MSNLLTFLLNASLILVFALSVGIERGMVRDVQPIPSISTPASAQAILNSPNPEIYRPHTSVYEPSVLEPALSDLPTEIDRAAQWLAQIKTISAEILAWGLNQLLRGGRIVESALTPPALKIHEQQRLPTVQESGMDDLPGYVQEPIVDLSL